MLAKENNNNRDVRVRVDNTGRHVGEVFFRNLSISNDVAISQTWGFMGAK